MQAPYFLEAGLNLSNFHHGTLNLTPIDHSIELISPKYFFSQVKWTKNLPAENFSLDWGLEASAEKLVWRS